MFILFFKYLFYGLKHSIYFVDYVADANCQAAWLFGEGGGVTVKDSSQNNNTATFKGVGEPAWGGKVPDFGIKGSAAGSVDFDENDDFIRVPHDASIDFADQDFSIAIRIKGNVSVASTWILCKGNGANPGLRYELVYDIIKKFNFVIDDNVHKTELYYDPGDASRLSWNSFVFRRNVATNKLTIHFNGVEVRSGDDNTGSISNIKDMFIGCGVSSGDTKTASFGGSLTELAIFDRLLNETEMIEIDNYGLRGKQPYPVGWLRKNLASGYNLFVCQYIKSKSLNYNPLKLPDGTIF